VYLVIFVVCAALALSRKLHFRVLKLKLDQVHRIAVYGDMLDNYIGNTEVCAIFVATLVNHRRIAEIISKLELVEGQLRRLGATFDIGKMYLARFILIGLVTIAAFSVTVVWHIKSARVFLGRILDFHTFVSWYGGKIYTPLLLVQFLYYMYKVLCFFEIKCKMLKYIYSKGSWLP
jgi:hypothetical protein